MNYTLLKQVLALIEEFQTLPADPAAASAENGELEAFSAWLHLRVPPPPDALQVARDAPNALLPDEAIIGQMITFLYRYLRGYSRLALANTPLLTYDDFTYLATAFTRQPITKTELIRRNIHETPTGNEVIKRLLAKGFLAETPSTTDRRSKLLSVTPAGQDVLFASFGPMDQLAHLAAGNLTAFERKQLVYLFHKLDAFHHPIYAESRPATFADLIARHPTYNGPGPQWSPPGGPPPGPSE